jgi:hypothetical protein
MSLAANEEDETGKNIFHVEIRKYGLVSTA